MIKNKKTILLILLLVAIACACAALCHHWKQNRENPVTIRIGMIAPLSGTHKDGGASMRDGAAIAVDALNSEDNMSGMSYELLVEDDENDPREAAIRAKKLVYEDKVSVLIGSYSSQCSETIKAVANEAHVPLILPVAMKNELIDADDYVFRNTLSTAGAQDKINEYVNMEKGEYALLDGLHAETIGILWQKDSWGESIQKRISQDLHSIGRQNAILFNEDFDLGQTDFRSFYESHEGDMPDVMYVISSGEEAVEVVKQGREAGYPGLFYGEGGFNYDNFDQALGETAEGCLFTSLWHPSFSTPMSDRLVLQYSRKYQTMPDMFAATSYEAIYILANSLKKVSRQDLEGPQAGKNIRDGLDHLKKMQGLSGTITFDENGQCDRPIFMLQKRWDGSSLQSFVVYPKEYSQGDVTVRD